MTGLFVKGMDLRVVDGGIKRVVSIVDFFDFISQVLMEHGFGTEGIEDVSSIMQKPGVVYVSPRVIILISQPTVKDVKQGS